MNLFIVIPTYNRRKLLKQCLESLKNQTCQNFRVLVVVDGSTDGTLEMLKSEFQNVDYIIGTGDWWWTRSINEGIKYTLNKNPTHLLLLNDDVVLPKNFFQNICDVISDHRGEELLFNVAAKDIHTKDWCYLGVRNNWKKPLSTIYYVNIYKSKPPKYIAVSYLYGRGLIIPISVFNKIGLFDDKSFPQAFADIDFSLRAKKVGYKLKLATKPFLYSYTEETCRKYFESHYNLKNLCLRLISKRSSSNLLYLLRYNYRHCPKKYFFQYTIINVSAVIGGYILRWFSRNEKKL